MSFYISKQPSSQTIQKIFCQEFSICATVKIYIVSELIRYLSVSKISLNLQELEDICFFSVRSNFVSPNEHQKHYFHDILLLVFMSEIKLGKKKINKKISFCFHSR